MGSYKRTKAKHSFGVLKLWVFLVLSLSIRGLFEYLFYTKLSIREFPVSSLQTAQPHVIHDHNKLIYLNKSNDLLSFSQAQRQNPM